MLSDIFENTKQSIGENLGRELKIEEEASINSFSEISAQTLSEMKSLAEKSTTKSVEYALFLFSKEIRMHAISFVHLVVCGKMKLEDFPSHVERKNKNL